MLTTSASDLEHNSNNSNDHLDVKDLSFRSNQPQQAPVITTTAPSAAHMDTSDYESTRSPTANSASTSTPSTRITTANINHHNHHLGNGSLSPPHHESVLRNVRVRKLSETSTDIEHGNNYKFKNYIQQRFTHENYHSEESMQSSQCATENDKDHDRKSGTSLPTSSTINGGSSKVVDMTRDDCKTTNGHHHDIKNELHLSHPLQNARNGKLNASSSTLNGNHTIVHHHSIPIPIFACHAQGFYIPLNIDYDLLLPYLGGLDLLSKSFAHLPPLHPISINVNYAPTAIKALAPTNFIKPKVEGITNGW